MLYMLRPEVDTRIAAFVENGGTFVATYWSGIVNENDLVFQSGFPGGALREVMGIWAEEIDALYEDDRNAVIPEPGNPLGLTGPYEARDYCDLIHSEGAEVLAAYGEDFYAGRPALTVNTYGEGRAYTISSNNDDAFLGDFYGALDADLTLKRALDAPLPHGVTAQLRTDGERDFVFLMNFNDAPTTVDLGAETYTDLLTGAALTGAIALDVYDVKVLTQAV
jgi:beta-galactosidase